MPINYGTNDVFTSGVIASPSGSFTNSLLFNGSLVSTGAKKMLQVHQQEVAISAFVSNQLVYSEIDHDPYNGYDNTTGQYTVPSGQGGIYLVFLSFVAGGTSIAGTASANLAAVGSSLNNTVSLNNGSSYAVVDNFIRFAGMSPIFLNENETIHIDAYPTAILASNNDFPFFNEFSLYKI